MRCNSTLFLVMLFASTYSAASEPIKVASKNFGESYILGELTAQLLEQDGFDVERRFGLGGTLICYEALASGEIDLYVEYTGTIEQAILKLTERASIAELNERIAEKGIRLLEPLGFNNTYAIVVTRDVAERNGLRTVGDLATARDLKVVLSHEFLEREDGWPGLAAAYGLSSQVVGMEHGLAYQALNDGEIDVMDAYSTDGELKRYDLTILDDDKGFFPEYLAVPLIRKDLPARAVAVLRQLAGILDDPGMQAMNAEVVFGKRSFADVANEFLVNKGLADERLIVDAIWPNLVRNTLQHLKLTGIALAAAILVGVFASLAVFRIAALSRALIYFSGLLQTVPSIALLALMIPFFGIGMYPAIVALFLYSLLPILRNTITALTTLDPTLIRVATAMGLSNREQLRYVYIPLSLPSMLAGIRTAAVISIGTATLAAFIGAGGLGDPIVTGLALNDVGLILQGAVPAALLAIITELIFELIERLVLPGHLRVEAAG
ncbi:MAG: ABC transporter permease subunit [Proteobacteria bacterium]|nr:ABC transporter permease subunit [Pseudomonadota bacterium]